MHSHFTTGRPCFCSWGERLTDLGPRTAATWQEIRQWKKFQNPKAQTILDFLERRGYVNQHTEKWIPWLLKEIHKGHIQWVDNGPRWDREGLLYDQPAADGGTLTERLTPGHFRHWTDWLNSGHPTRQQAGNVEQLDVHELKNFVHQWDEDMKAQQKNRSRDAGTPVHTWPDGWTLRELGPHEVKDEGDAMGHCVGSYRDDVENGNLKVLSLRDPGGDPHITAGIRYDETSHPGGHLWEYKGNGNAIPKDEYNQRFREYFATMPVHERPLSEDYYDDEPEDWEALERMMDAQRGEPGVDHLGLPTDTWGEPPHLDLDRWHESLVRQPYYGRDPYHDYKDAQTFFDYLSRTDRINEYVPILQGAEEQVYDEFDNHYYPQGGPYSHQYREQMGASHPGVWQDEDWEEEVERQGLEDVNHMDPEWRNQYTQDWEEAEGEEREYYLQQWPSYQAIQNMWEQINRNYDYATDPATGEARFVPKRQQIAKTATRHFHHHFTYGHPCLCPWGSDPGLEHLGAKTAAKLDWLRERKDLQDDEAQEFLNQLEMGGYAEGADKLLPWIIREWRKGRFDVLNYLLRFDDNRGHGRTFPPHEAKEIQELLAKMKNHRRGLDIMQHNLLELFEKVRAFKEEIEEKERRKAGQVIHRFDDGWTVRRLQNGKEAEWEGDELGHCVGAYGEAIESGHTMILSLRDPNNRPKATMELAPQRWFFPEDPDKLYSRDQRHNFTTEGGRLAPMVPHLTQGSVTQWYARSNASPEQEWTERMREALEPYDIDVPDSYEKWWDDVYYQPGAETVQEYLGAWRGTEYGPEPPEEYYNACADAEHNGVEEPNLEYEPDDFYRIWQDHTSHFVPEAQGLTRQWWHRPAEFDPQEAKHLLDAAKSQGHLKEFHPHWKGWQAQDMDEYDSDHQALNDWWTKEFSKHTNPDTGEFENPVYRGAHPETYETVYETALDRWWARNQEVYPQLPGVEWQNEGQLPPLPDHLRQGVFSKIASRNPPLYYRFVLHPDTGQVELGANTDDHPALVPYHEELAGKVNRPNLIHGYAYRLNGGWRLTDWEHKPLEDHFVASRVLLALRGKDPVRGPESGPEDAWTPVNHDYDRLHYGLPMQSQD